MKKVIMLFFMLIASKSYSQTPLIKVKFKVEKETLNISKFKVASVLGKDTVYLQVTGNEFIIPDSLYQKKRNIIFNINQYELIMNNIPLTWNPLYPIWTLKVDFYPFLEENKWITKKSKKSIKWIYILDYNTGKMLTFYRYKKNKPSN